MPNWCMNELQVEAPDAKSLEQFILKMNSACTEEDEVLSFQSILPMPEILEDTTSPHIDDEKIRVKIFEALGKHMSFKDFEDKYKDDSNFSSIISDIEKFNHNILAHEETCFYNWYDWQYANWGVKWGASESVLDHYEETKCSYNYQTAWGTAVGWLGFLAKTYPAFKFHNKCADPSMNFHTELIFEDGELLEEINIEFSQAIEQGEWGGVEVWDQFTSD